MHTYYSYIPSSKYTLGTKINKMETFQHCKRISFILSSCFIHPHCFSSLSCCFVVWPYYRKPLICLGPAAESQIHNRREASIPAHDSAQPSTYCKLESSEGLFKVYSHLRGVLKWQTRLKVNNKPGENLMSEMASLRWWKDTRSSKVSAFTMMKLPSFSPTARALPSGEKQQQRPPGENQMSVYYLEPIHFHLVNDLVLNVCSNTDAPFLSLRTASMQWLGDRSHMRRVLSSLTVAQRGRWGWEARPHTSPSMWPWRHMWTINVPLVLAKRQRNPNYVFSCKKQK